ncbi:14310_t:CDS:1, partial [Acaulospora colombiana]
DDLLDSILAEGRFLYFLVAPYINNGQNRVLTNILTEWEIFSDMLHRFIQTFVNPRIDKKDTSVLANSLQQYISDKLKCYYKDLAARNVSL